MADLDRVVLVPWYEPDDFARLRHMRGNSSLPPSYDRWQEEAKEQVQQLLATGVAAQIVSLRVDDYLAWLSLSCAADTPQSRLAYLAHLAVEAGCLGRQETHATSWPGFPTFN